MSIRQNNVVKSGLWYVAGNFIQEAVAFLTTPVFTRILSTSEYGVVSTYSSYASLVTMIATLNIWTCIQVSRLDFREDNDRFVSSIFTLSAGAVFVCYLAVKVLEALGIQIFSLPSGLVDIMFLEVLFTDAYNVLVMQSRAYYRYRQVTALAVAMTCMSVVLSLFLITALENNLYYGKIIGNVCAAGIVGIYSIIQIWRRGRCAYNRQYWKYALQFAVPLIPNNIAGTLLSSFDRVMITDFVGSSMTAIYSLGYTCCNVVQVLSSSINSAWCPWFFDRMVSGEKDRVRESFRSILLLFLYICSLAVAIAPELIFILGGTGYRASKWVIPPVILGICFQFICSFYCNVLHLRHKTKWIAFGTIIAAALNILLNWIFIPLFGYLAAAYTTLIGYAVKMGYDILIVRHFEKGSVFDGRYIVGALIAMTVYVVAAVVMYQTFWFIRYIVISVITGILVVKYRGQLSALWRQYVRKGNGGL